MARSFSAASWLTVSSFEIAIDAMQALKKRPTEIQIYRGHCRAAG